jgi:hypothetical protein
MLIIVRALLSAAATAFVVALAAYASPALAGMVTTEAVAPASQAVTQERERVKELVSRPEVARRLESLGVLPKDAAERVDALTEDEVRALAARIDALPAGGLSDQNWLLVIIVILLIVLIL